MGKIYKKIMLINRILKKIIFKNRIFKKESKKIKFMKKSKNHKDCQIVAKLQKNKNLKNLFFYKNKQILKTLIRNRLIKIFQKILLIIILKIFKVKILKKLINLLINLKII